MTKINCPNCRATKEIKTKYNDNLTKQATCDNCNFTVPQYCWDFISEVAEEEEDIDRETS